MIRLPNGLKFKEHKLAFTLLFFCCRLLELNLFKLIQQIYGFPSTCSVHVEVKRSLEQFTSTRTASTISQG
jgi:hypothetical protein